MFVGIVVAGGSHGLIFLPVCLSLVGYAPAQPESKVRPERADKGEPSQISNTVIGSSGNL